MFDGLELAEPLEITIPRPSREDADESILKFTVRTPHEIRAAVAVIQKHLGPALAVAYHRGLEAHFEWR